MKVLTLHQPWATLIALGVKTIETRPQAYRSLVGQRIAIHAAARRPEVDPPQGLRAVGDWWVEDEHDGDFNIHRWTKAPCCDRGHQCVDEIMHPLPLGAIVCTAAVTDSVPMVAQTLFRAPPMIYTDVDGRLLHWKSSQGSSGGAHYGGEWDDITDQLPYGDFRPGRYGLLLANVEALAEPVPFKGGQGLSRSWDPEVAA